LDEVDGMDEVGEVKVVPMEVGVLLYKVYL
jgi:hypothetical protein